MKSTKVLLNISAFFCFVYFVVYIFSLVFIPVGIYCFLAGKTFLYKADHLDETLFVSNKSFKGYVIFASIFCFPFGLLVIIPFKKLTSNNITISNLTYSRVDENSNDIETRQTSSEQKNENNSENVSGDGTDESLEEKLAKFKKLENFKEKGFITEEELEQAREQIFGKKE